jgi:hypothetical protein
MYDLCTSSSAVLALIGLGLAVAVSRLHLKLKSLELQFKPVLDIEAEINTLQSELELIKTRNSQAVQEHTQKVETLNKQYSSAKQLYDRLSQEISLLEEHVEDMSFGVYNPHFIFQSSEEYKNNLQAVRNKRKLLIRGNKATTCKTEWRVHGSKQEGSRMVKKNAKLMLRAFNGEADAAIANANWNNILKMEERIKKSFQVINDLGSTTQINLTDSYLQICLDELRLEFELKNKRHEELEEQRAIREKLREEEKAQRDFERARREAEQDELRHQKSLEKARAEIATATGKELEQLNEKILLLEERVKEAEQNKQRAISMAQQTRCGYLYIISNIGTFGEDVYKIGMTRRLDPTDRVRELGDASVPFGFDIHAMVYSDDAPTLESEIHAHLSKHRVNRVNLRREFFKTQLGDIESFLKSKGLEIELFSIAEAKEYRESCALIEKSNTNSVSQNKEPEFPATLFN